MVINIVSENTKNAHLWRLAYLPTHSVFIIYAQKCLSHRSKRKLLKRFHCSAIKIISFTLTGYFIKYTLLVSGWTLFLPQNWLNSSQHWLNKVLETFISDCGPFLHDGIKQLLPSRWFHIHDANLLLLYWIEIYVNSSSCSRDQFEMIWDLWDGMLFCWKQPSEVYCGDWHGQHQYSCSPRKYPPHDYITCSSLNQGFMAGQIHSFMLFSPNSDPTSIHGVGSKFCCCSSSTLRFYVLCLHRCSSAYRVAIWVIWFEAVCKCSIDVRLHSKLLK